MPDAAAPEIPALGVLIRLDNFEGPLDLLLHLIQQDEMEIWEISIRRITRQYLDYLEQMEALNVEIAGEFLVMAATLMRLKSKRLLPRPVPDDELCDEPQSEEDLIRQLLTYKLFKEVAGDLQARRERAGPRFPRGYRPRLPGDYSYPLQEIDLFRLVETLHGVEERRRREEAAIHQVRLDDVRLEDQVSLVLARLEALQGRVAFWDLFDQPARRVEAAVTLLAVLELARQQVLTVLQEEPFADLWLVSRSFESAVTTTTLQGRLSEPLSGASTALGGTP